MKTAPLFLLLLLLLLSFLTVQGQLINAPKLGQNCHFQRPNDGKCVRSSSCGKNGKSGVCSNHGRANVVCCPRSELINRDIIPSDPLVVGGIATKPKSWPWMVSIHLHTPNQKRYLCGGVLIDNSNVLTAAHCFEKLDPKPCNYVVKVNGHRRSSGFNQEVKSIKIYSKYKAEEYYYDIALMKLEKPVPPSLLSSPVSLPAKKEKYDNKTAIVLGWGDTSFGGRLSEVLHEATVNVIPTSECDENYKKLKSAPFPKGITNLFLCAGHRNGGKDACQGDSGSPLMIQDSSKTWILIGIVSFGYQCGLASYPGVYTSVGPYLKWIDIWKNRE